VVGMKPGLLNSAHGEVGFLYGAGSHGVSVERGYMIGEVGDDKFHITVGASYENVNGNLNGNRFSRWGR
jgi:hypothetical protein